MGWKPEIAELLSGFDKRMKFINIARFLLDYAVTRFRMAEYMKRDNYAEALDQSRELVSKIRNMKVSMDDFIRRCRENIAKISVDQYETVVTRVRSLLETEYEELQAIQDNAKERAERLLQAQQSGVTTEDIKKHRKALKEIIGNIQLTIEEQRALINKKMSLSEEYQSILSDSYAMSRYERLSFDQDILAPLRQGRRPLELASSYLFFPLTKPTLENRFSVENLYAAQVSISEAEEGDPENLDTEEETEDITEVRNRRFLRICTELLSYMRGKDSFKASEFAASLNDSTLFEFCRENALPLVFLSLYSFQTVSISDWKAAQEMVITPMGEFELSWCLSEMPDENKELSGFTVKKLDREFSFAVTKETQQVKIQMSDFRIEVIR